MTLFLLILLWLNSNIFSTAFAETTDYVDVAASIPPKPSDAEFVLSGNPEIGVQLKEDDIVTVDIKYRSKLSYGQEAEITAQWEEGLISGTESNYIDIFDYVVGSAETADDGTVPIINLQNQSVTWSFSQLEPTENLQTVSFQLQVRNDIPTSELITADINAHMSLLGNVLQTEEISYNIEKTIYPTSTPTPTNTLTPTPTSTITPTPPPTTITIQPTTTPGPTSTPTSSPTATSTPTISPTPTITEKLKFESIQIQTITNNYVEILFSINKLTNYEIVWGLNTKNLTEKMSTLTPQKKHLAKIENLNPETNYYFQITIIDQQGNQLNSDIFTFKTAAEDKKLIIPPDKITITSDDLYLSNPEAKTILISNNQKLSLAISVEEAEKIKQIFAKITQPNVLGLNSLKQPPAIEKTELIETSPGNFTGHLQIPKQIGKYQISLEITSTKGNYLTQTLPYQVYSSSPLKIINAKSGRPIENVDIKIFKYDQKSKNYLDFLKSFSLIRHTNHLGELPISLPAGKYKFEVNAPGFKPEIYQLELETRLSNYPLIELTPAWSITETKKYFLQSTKLFTGFINRQINDFFSSSIAKNIVLLINITIVGPLVFLAWIKNWWQFGRKNHLNFFNFFRFVFIWLLDTLIFTSLLSAVLFSLYQGPESSIHLIALATAMGIAKFDGLFKRQPLFKKTNHWLETKTNYSLNKLGYFNFLLIWYGSFLIITLFLGNLIFI